MWPCLGSDEQMHVTREGGSVALYYRDEQSGDHVVTHEAEEFRFATRTEALKAVHDLVDACNARRHHPAQRAQGGRR